MTLTDKAASFARTETEEGTVGDGENEPEMVRKVAQAMIDARQLPAGTVVNMHAFLRDARAAIAAMREPNEEMLEASCAAHVEQWNGVKKAGYRPGPGDVAKPCFVAAIDAALGNPQVAE